MLSSMRARFYLEGNRSINMTSLAGGVIDSRRETLLGRKCNRKLPRQVDTSKVDFTGASGLDRNATGGTWPRLSWGRSVL